MAGERSLTQFGGDVTVRIGPFNDYQDAVTPVTTLSGSLVPYLSKNGSFAALTNTSPPPQAYDRDGYYVVTLQAASDLDTVGSLQLSIANSGVHLNVDHSYDVVDGDFSSLKGGGTIDVNVLSISGDQTAAVNLEAMFDGTGYSDPNAPATQAQATGLSGVAPAALRDINLDHLMAAAVTGTDVVDDSALAMLVSASATADWDTFDNETESLQAIRDRGDVAWITGGAGGLSAADVLAQAQLAIVNSGVLGPVAAPSNFNLFSVDGSGRVDVGSWLGTAVTVGGTSNLPAVDAQAISDNTTAADNVQANIGNLDATVSSRSTLTAAQAADQVWDETQSTHTTAGSFGEIATEIADILTDTAAMQPNVDAAISSRSSHTAADAADAVWDEAQSAHVAAGSFGEVATEVASILADTNELQTDDVPGLIAGLNNLSAAQVNAEVDTALADYDPPTKAELDTAQAAIQADIAALPTAAENAAGLLDLTDGIETGVTPRQALRAMSAVLAGQSTGVDTGSPNYRAINNSGTSRVSGTASDGNRSSITLNL